MTEKRQTSQGYIICILQHFATKLRNITNFVMLFQAVIKFCSLGNTVGSLARKTKEFSKKQCFSKLYEKPHYYLLKIYNQLINNLSTHLNGTTT